MPWLLQNWQTVAALGVVALTACLFLRRLLRRGRASCGGGCECPAKKAAQGPGSRQPPGKGPVPPEFT